MSSSVDSLCDTLLVYPFVNSTKEVFETMLQSKCQVGEMQPVVSGSHMSALTAVIGLTGGMTGAIALSTDVHCAFKILERMTGLETDEVDEFVRDAFGEMVNMIGGKGKRDLAYYSLNLGLPQVIVGEDYTVYSPRWAKHFWIPIEAEIGKFTLDVGFDTKRGSTS